MQNSTVEADAILRRAAWRLVPLILAMYIAAFLNRVNVGFAALTMNQDLGFSPEVYGWGTGVFFLGYLVFEVPSNLIMEKVGARIWMARIMITWALVSMAFAFVQGPVTFALLRFLLGLAEAGFYPGILLYFTYWFPAATRARILALFCMGIPISNILGSPLSSWLLGVEGYGFKGWQWMYLLEGIPTIALGFVAFWGLPDNPRKASFLSEREKDIVMARLAAEAKPEVHGFGAMMKDWRVWALMIPDFAIVFGIYALGFWMPQMVHAMGYSSMQRNRLHSDDPLQRIACYLVGHRRVVGSHRQAGAAFLPGGTCLRRRLYDARHWAPAMTHGRYRGLLAWRRAGPIPGSRLSGRCRRYFWAAPRRRVPSL